jgi:predicted phage terminase large subunit-like protein
MLTNEQIKKLPADVRRRYKALKVKKRRASIKDNANENFLAFVKTMWPDFVQGSHHRHISDKFDKLARGEITRLIVNMPPRHTKSEFASYLLPAWMVGRDPKLKIIQATHTAELAFRFGRKTKNLIDTEEYQKIFKTTLQEDSKAAGRWETSAGGEYFAAGVGGAITGRGADLLIIDDPHSEQDAMSRTALDSAYEWYTSGPRQRLQPGGKIVLVMTRWSTRDLTGRLINNQKEPKSDQWHVVEFPAIMDHEPVWPQYWTIEELEKVQASLPAGKWNAQWMQNPVAEQGALIKRDWWNMYQGKEVPQLSYVLQSYDTAFSKKETADFSAITTWGLFYPYEDSLPNIILLDAVKDRFDFPELRRQALQQYHHWKPDMVVIEAKASGQPLIDEFRKLYIPVFAFTPSKGNDKHSRVNSVAPLFESGIVWAPDRDFAEEVVEQCAAFPYGDHDDLVDCTTQALLRFRQSGLLQHPEDYIEETTATRPRTYY